MQIFDEIMGVSRQAAINAAESSAGSSGIGSFFGNFFAQTVSSVAGQAGIPVNLKSELAKYSGYVKRANSNMITINAFLQKVIPAWGKYSQGPALANEFSAESNALYSLWYASKRASQVVVDELNKFQTGGKVMDFAYYAGFKQAADNAWKKANQAHLTWQADYAKYNKQLTQVSMVRGALSATGQTFTQFGSQAIGAAQKTGQIIEEGVPKVGKALESGLGTIPYLPYILIAGAGLYVYSLLPKRRKS